MPLVDLDDPGELRSRWAALAAVAHACGRDRIWWADERGLHYEDPRGNDLRLLSLGDGRAVLYGYHAEESRTAVENAYADLLSGAPDWIGQPEVRHRMVTGQLGFVFGHFSGTWARAEYPGDPWQPLDDGFSAVGSWLTDDRETEYEIAEMVLEWTGAGLNPDEIKFGAMGLIRAAGTRGIRPSDLEDFFALLRGAQARIRPDGRGPDVTAGAAAATAFATSAVAKTGPPAAAPPTAAPPTAAPPTAVPPTAAPPTAAPPAARPAVTPPAARPAPGAHGSPFKPPAPHPSPGAPGTPAAPPLPRPVPASDGFPEYRPAEPPAPAVPAPQPSAPPASTAPSARPSAPPSARPSAPPSTPPAGAPPSSSPFSREQTPSPFARESGASPFGPEQGSSPFAPEQGGSPFAPEPSGAPGQGGSAGAGSPFAAEPSHAPAQSGSAGSPFAPQNAGAAGGRADQDRYAGLLEETAEFVPFFDDDDEPAKPQARRSNGATEAGRTETAAPRDREPHAPAPPLTTSPVPPSARPAGHVLPPTAAPVLPATAPPVLPPSGGPDLPVSSSPDLPPSAPPAGRSSAAAPVLPPSAPDGGPPAGRRVRPPMPPADAGAGQQPAAEGPVEDAPFIEPVARRARRQTQAGADQSPRGERPGERAAERERGARFRLMPDAGMGGGVPDASLWALPVPEPDGARRRTDKDVSGPGPERENGAASGRGVVPDQPARKRAYETPQQRAYEIPQEPANDAPQERAYETAQEPAYDGPQERAYEAPREPVYDVPQGPADQSPYEAPYEPAYGGGYGPGYAAAQDEDVAPAADAEPDARADDGGAAGRNGVAAGDVTGGPEGMELPAELAVAVRAREGRQAAERAEFERAQREVARRPAGAFESLEDAMRAEPERPRPSVEPGQAFRDLHEWCRERTKIVPSGFTIHVYVANPQSISYTFDLDPPEVPGARIDPQHIDGLLQALWNEETDAEHGGWMFARIDAAGRTLRVDRWYDSIPSWWEHGRAVDSHDVAWHLGVRAPRWQPSYAGRLELVSAGERPGHG